MPANRQALLTLLVLLLSACAAPQNTISPRISRLPDEDMSRLLPARPVLSLDDLLDMARSGASPEAIVSRLRQSGQRVDLTPAQIVEWHARGLPMPVLQALYEEREKALHNDLARQLVERDQQCSAEVMRERQRAMPCPDPYWSASYGTWGAYPYRRGGVFGGW